MPTLSIHLLDGFADDIVEVLVDGQDISPEGPVTTKLLHGLAETVNTRVTGGPAHVKVRVPGRDIAAELDTEVHDDLDLLASIEEGRLDLRVSDVKPGFM